jgi:hypothetical protein
MGADRSLAGLDRRIHSDDDLDHLKALPHLARLVRVCWETRPPSRPNRASAAPVGARARVPGPLVRPEPPLLHHLHRPAPRARRARDPSAAARRRAAGRLGPPRLRGRRRDPRDLELRRLLIVRGPNAGHSRGAHDQRRRDTVHQDAGVSVLYHRDLPSGHLDASRGRRAPPGQPTRQRSRQAERGRPRPWVAQDLHQQEPGYLGGWPGDGGQGGLPPHRGRGGRSCRL